MAIILSALSAISVGAEVEIVQEQAQLNSFSNYLSNTSHRTVGLRQITNNETTAPTNSEHESQIIQFQEAFTNASVIQLSQPFSSLIEKVYHQTKKCKYPKFDFLNQDTLFYILFQVIISTNAP